MKKQNINDLYKTTNAIYQCTETDTICYNGREIIYDPFTRAKFIDTFGDDKVGECCGHLKLEVWNNGKFSKWDMSISTVSDDVIVLDFLDIKLLKKLNDFLNYALKDIVEEQEQNNENV